MNKEIPEEVKKKYETYKSNIEWHIKTNFANSNKNELALLDQRVSDYTEVINDLERIQQFIEPLQSELKELREEKERLKAQFWDVKEIVKSHLSDELTRSKAGETDQQPEGKVVEVYKVIGWLERLQNLLESGESRCFDNEYDLADSKELRKLIDKLIQPQVEEGNKEKEEEK
jgi:archaellum component FlaC